MGADVAIAAPRGLRIVGIGGSLNRGSSSLAALDACLRTAAEIGAEVIRFSIRELDLPLYDPAADPPDSARALAAAVADSDGLILSSPMYHGTVSGSFKNALDWLQLLAPHDPPFLTDIPVGLISAAGGVQPLQAVNTMDFIVRALRGWTIPFAVPIQQSWRVFDGWGAPNAEVAEQLQILAREVVDASARLSRRAGSESAGSVRRTA